VPRPCTRDLAARPVGLGARSIELQRTLDILHPQLRPLLAVGPGPIGERLGRARLELDGAREVVERVVVGLGLGVGEAARHVGCHIARGDLDRGGEILDGRGRVAAFQIGLAARDIEIGAARVESDGPAEILDRLVVALDDELGLGAAAVGRAEAGIEADGAREVPAGRKRAMGGQVRASAPR
jgi:hypothetical protein